MTEYDHTVEDVDDALTEYIEHIEDTHGVGSSDDRYQRGYYRGLLKARTIVREPDPEPLTDNID